MNLKILAGLGGFLALASGLFLIGPMATRSQAIRVAELSRLTHIHGLEIDPAGGLFVATHHGLYRFASDGQGELVSPVQDFMGFNAHPSEPGRLYASGHPAGGGNLGLIVSTDSGHTWTQLARGLFGPVDFHQLTVSPADPLTMYGAFRGLQISRNGGVRWDIAGALPAGLIALAASARSADTLYAGTQGGLLVSRDAGASWQPVVTGPIVTMVKVTPAGTVYAFAVDTGLLRSQEDLLAFEVLSTPPSILLHLAVDPNDPLRLLAATSTSEILVSDDGGQTWAAFGG